MDNLKEYILIVSDIAVIQVRDVLVEHGLYNYCRIHSTIPIGWRIWLSDEEAIMLKLSFSSNYAILKPYY